MFLLLFLLAQVQATQCTDLFEPDFRSLDKSGLAQLAPGVWGYNIVADAGGVLVRFWREENFEVEVFTPSQAMFGEFRPNALEARQRISQWAMVQYVRSSLGQVSRLLRTSYPRRGWLDEFILGKTSVQDFLYKLPYTTRINIRDSSGTKLLGTGALYYSPKIKLVKPNDPEFLQIIPWLRPQEVRALEASGFQQPFSDPHPLPVAKAFDIDIQTDNFGPASPVEINGTTYLASVGWDIEFGSYAIDHRSDQRDLVSEELYKKLLLLSYTSPFNVNFGAPNHSMATADIHGVEQSYWSFGDRLGQRLYVRDYGFHVGPEERMIDGQPWRVLVANQNPLPFFEERRGYELLSRTVLEELLGLGLDTGTGQMAQ